MTFRKRCRRREEEIMEWTQVLTIIISLLGGVFYIHYDIREIKKDMQQQNIRIDKLYEMWCETQKEIKQIYIDKYK